MRHFEIVGQAVADAEDALSRSPAGHTVVGYGNGVAVGFEWLVKLGRCSKETFDNGRRRGERLVDVALLTDIRFREIGRIRPDPRRIRISGGFLLHHERQRRGFDFDDEQRIETRLLRRARDRGQFFAVEADGPLTIAFNNDSLDAGNLFGLFDVDARYLRGRPPRPVNHAVEPALGLDVGTVLGRTGDFCGGIDTWRTLPDHVAFFRPAKHDGRPRLCSRLSRRRPSAWP